MEKGVKFRWDVVRQTFVQKSKNKKGYGKRCKIHQIL